MFGIKAKWLRLDGQTMKSESDSLAQVPGTDGGGGHWNEDGVTVDAALRSAGYFDTIYEPSHQAFILHIQDLDGYSYPLTKGVHYTIVRSAVNGPYRRIVFDSSLTPGSVKVPDATDPVPSVGLEAKLADGEKFRLNYAR